MMNQHPTPFLDRFAALQAWFEPKRLVYNALPNKEKPASFRHAYMLMLMLEIAMRRVTQFIKDAQQDPMSATMSDMMQQHLHMASFLLPRFEYWMKGIWSEQDLSLLTHEWCKGQIMDGRLVDFNSTSSLANMAGVYAYQNYCYIVKLINDSVLAALQEKDAPDPVSFAPKKRASRAKA